MKLKKRERNTVGILEWRSLRRRESATGCKDGFSCCGELDANTTDSSSITPPTTTPISLSLSLSLCVCVCVLVLLQRKRNEHTKGKGNAKGESTAGFSLLEGVRLAGGVKKWGVERF